MEAPKCKFTAPDGTPCRAYALTGQDFCYQHSPDPKIKSARLIARSKGGQANKDKRLPKVSLESAVEVSQMLAELVNLYRAQEISSQRATILSRLSDGLLKSFELGEIEERVAELEQAYEER